MNDIKVDADILIVGSGVGGASLAKQLSRSKARRKILIVEKGDRFSSKQFGSQLKASYRFYDKLGLLSRSQEGIIYYRTIMRGGTSVVSCANGVRTLEKELKQLGIDLTGELNEAEKELAINSVPKDFLREGTAAIMKAAKELGVDMVPMPKFINFKKCKSCGNCVLGCHHDAKWSALDYLEDAVGQGVSLVEGIDITKVIISDNRTVGVEGRKRKGGKVKIYANTIVLAAGGIGTPVILQNSGIRAGQKLFLDVFTVVMGATKGAGLVRDVSMAAVSHHEGFILSPFLDCALALLSALPIRHIVKIAQRKRMLGIMVKIKDDSVGKVNKSGRVEKTLTRGDLSKLDRGVEISKKILVRAGADPRTIVSAKLRGAHPGGTAAIGDVVDVNLKTKVDNLYIVDASVFPESPGAPPIVTIIALAKRLAKQIAREDQIG